jgi:adenosylmethionine---8-amino-7-oxononanoate aminotransferase
VSSWVGRDRELLWHPYTQHGLGREILPVRSGQGAWLELEDGRRVLDAISSWWVNVHGHSHPAIVRAIQEQASRLEHVLFAGFTHEPAVRLAEALIGAAREAGARSTRVFYSDNGSTAVEAALKMAYQFHSNRGEKGRTGFLALRGSYHGDTLGAMAAGDPEGFHSIFRPLMPAVDFVDPGDLPALEEMIARKGTGLAAMIVEPLVQGASGMRMYPPEFLRKASALCRQAGILFICDEVFTGFFRTGTCFAFEQAAIAPDLVTLSKGITGGFLPLAVTLATEEVFDAFKGTDIRQAFLHGHSYTANPIACAAALASWRLLQEPECQRRIARIAEVTRERISALARHPGIKAARSLGTIGAIEIGQGGYFTSGTRDLAREAIERGVLLRPLGETLYSVPPYCVTDQELGLLFDAMEALAGRG